MIVSLSSFVVTCRDSIMFVLLTVLVCSMLGSSAEFFQVARSKADYEEYGPSICRHSPIFGAI